MTVALVVAMADGGIIGRGGGLPWHLPADLVRFKRITMGHTLVMGRKTYESIGRPLPGRRSIVLTRTAGYHADGVRTAGGFAEALRLAGPDAKVFVIGGAEVYRRALPRADRLFVTRVRGRFEGDVVFPVYDESLWRLVEESAHEADARNPHPYCFQEFERVAAGKRPGLTA